MLKDSMDNSTNNQPQSQQSVNSSPASSPSGSTLGSSSSGKAPNPGNKFGLFLGFSSYGARRILSIIGLIVIVAAIPVTVYISQKQQEIRQRADQLTPTPTPTKSPSSTLFNVNSMECQAAKTDTILVIDSSGSMINDMDSQGKIIGKNDKLIKAKEAAKLFIDELAKDNRNKVGIVNFGTKSKLVSPLSSDYASVKSSIDNISAEGWTCTQCGILRSNSVIDENKADGAKKVIILLTDGLANTVRYGTALPSGAQRPPFPSISYPSRPTEYPYPSRGEKIALNAGTASAYEELFTYQVAQSVAEDAAIDASKAGFNSANTVFYTIGLGKDVNEAFLKKMATQANGKYYFAPTSTDLAGIYKEISEIIGKGSLNGFVFNDANSNGVFDSNEEKLSGWELRLNKNDADSTLVETVTTDSSGDFSINGICDGDYTFSQTVKDGFTQTVPKNPDKYTINITNGSSYSDKIFGNTSGTVSPGVSPSITQALTPSVTQSLTPTTTGTPSVTPKGDLVTTVEYSFKLQGIGKNVQGSENPDPRFKDRWVNFEVFDKDNKKLAEKVGFIPYDSSTGLFKGSFETKEIPAGEYKAVVKIKSNKYLRRLIGKDSNNVVLNIKAGQKNTLPLTTLLIGDINDDNNLDIEDYNIYLSCFNGKSDNSQCGEVDLNDDGNTDNPQDLRDYKWLFENFQLQTGD